AFFPIAIICSALLSAQPRPGGLVHPSVRRPSCASRQPPAASRPNSIPAPLEDDDPLVAEELLGLGPAEAQGGQLGPRLVVRGPVEGADGDPGVLAAVLDQHQPP